MWILLALLCIGVGLVMYSGLQPEIPDELSFLKTKPPAATAVVDGDASNTTALPSISAGSWRMLASADGTEISRDFADEIKSSTQRYDSPTFYVTCYRKSLYVRIDTRLHTKGEKTAEVAVQGKTDTWLHGEGQNIYAPDAQALLKRLQGSAVAKVAMEFDEAPRQTLRLKLDGFDQAVSQVKKDCGL